MNAKPQEDLEWLCLMQHYGCPTRLLDFTKNPLIALFFASDPGHNVDGEVIITGPIQFGHKFGHKKGIDVFNQTEPCPYDPPDNSGRVIGQSGCFIVCPNPNKPLALANSSKVEVSMSQKEGIRRELAILGVSYSRLFPGLMGVCHDLKDILVNGLEEQVLFDQYSHLL